LQRLGESGSRTDPTPSSVAFRYFVSPGHFALAFRIMPIQLHRRAVAPMTSHVTCGLRCWPSCPPAALPLPQVLDRPLQHAVAPAPRHPCTVAPPPNVPRPCGPSAAARVGSIFRLRDGSHEAGDGAGGGARRIGKGRDCTVCWIGDAAQSASTSPGGALEIEPAALLPVSIDRRTVSPTTRPAPASRMHGWPAVADLTSDRPIRIALVQVGAAPKAPAHFELSQQISQRSDPFLYSFNRAARRSPGWYFLVRRQVSHALRKTLPSRKRYVLLGCLLLLCHKIG
jgi:hypothetical protein